VEVDLFLNVNRMTRECVTTDDKHEKVDRELTDREANGLRQLARAADLYGPYHIGEDLTPTDGKFETLRFRPVAGGRAVVLVTSGNRSFDDQQARHDLVRWFDTILRHDVETLSR
jgi:hypothetical protein